MYNFTQDYFSRSIPVWNTMLAHLVGKPCRTLEIGTFEGRSALWMLDNVLTHESSRIDCVDVWEYCGVGDGGEERFDENTVGRRVTKNKGTSDLVLREFSCNQYDFAYIDGWHEARSVVKDWCNVLPLMKPGALICFDDYEWTGAHVRLPPKPGVDAILHLWHDVIEVKHVGWQVWVKLPETKIPASHMDTV